MCKFALYYLFLADPNYVHLSKATDCEKRSREPTTETLLKKDVINNPTVAPMDIVTQDDKLKQEHDTLPYEKATNRVELKETTEAGQAIKMEQVEKQDSAIDMQIEEKRAIDMQIEEKLVMEPTVIKKELSQKPVRAHRRWTEERKRRGDHIKKEERGYKPFKAYDKHQFKGTGKLFYDNEFNRELLRIDDAVVEHQSDARTRRFNRPLPSTMAAGLTTHLPREEIRAHGHYSSPLRNATNLHTLRGSFEPGSLWKESILAYEPVKTHRNRGFQLLDATQ
jgi:hypothetical protein